MAWHVGRYVMSLLLKKLFLFRCTLPMLRLTTVLSSFILPLVLTHLLCFHQRVRPPPSFLSPTSEAIILSSFPIAWFFGFLYYTEVPSLALVISTVVAASQGRHWRAALVRSFLFSWDYQEENWGKPILTTKIGGLARPHELHISSNEYHLGSLCVCI